MSNPIRISAKDLGALNMDDFCPRCFWLKRKSKKLPFQIFPGIFSSLDSYQKKVVHAFIDKYGAFPGWVEGFEDVRGYEKVPHWSKFVRVDPETGLAVSGVPDDILFCVDGHYIIPDYKTARFTENADKLLPIYEAQLNGYRWIWEGFGNVVKSTPLIYFEPYTEIDDIDSTAGPSGFDMDFTPHILQVEHKPDLIPYLLKKAKEIIDLEKPPTATAGCKDCEAVDKMLELMAA